jgi:hypothetical protein
VSTHDWKKEIGFPSYLIILILFMCACLVIQDIDLVEGNIVVILCNLECLLA